MNRAAAGAHRDPTCMQSSRYRGDRFSIVATAVCTARSVMAYSTWYIGATVRALYLFSMSSTMRGKIDGPEHGISIHVPKGSIRTCAGSGIWNQRKAIIVSLHHETLPPMISYACHQCSITEDRAHRSAPPLPPHAPPPNPRVFSFCPSAFSPTKQCYR